MKLPGLNNRLTVRQYAEDFERRFAQDVEGTLFLEDDGSAVRLTDEEAAHLIAAMRATLFDADGQTPFSGGNVGYASGGAAIGAAVLGAGIGLPGLGCALALPAAVAVLLLGPGVGAFRLDAAYQRGLARARTAMEGRERIAADARPAVVRHNRVRPVLQIVALVTAAMIVGLIGAYVSMPYYGRVQLDRALAHTAPTVLLLVVVLVFVARAVDATTRVRVPEVSIADALKERRRRPFR